MVQQIRLIYARHIYLEQYVTDKTDWYSMKEETETQYYQIFVTKYVSEESYEIPFH